MHPKIEETVYLDFITSDPATGAAADATGTPTAEIFEDATDTTVMALTVVKRTGKTGNYRVAVACTAANGFEAGKSYNVIAEATVGGVAAKARIGGFQLRAQSVDDVPTVAEIWAAVPAGPDIEDFAGAVWDELKAGHAVSGSYGASVPAALVAAGLDAIVVETGVNARQALAMIGAATAGKASGLATTTAIYYAMGASGTSTARISATTDADGNRTATTLTLPA